MVIKSVCTKVTALLEYLDCTVFYERLTSSLLTLAVLQVPFLQQADETHH